MAIENKGAIIDTPEEAPPAAPPRGEQIYVITNGGLEHRIGADAAEVWKHIQQADDPLAYRFYDDDQRRWAWWAKLGVDNKYTPHDFPLPDDYGTTSAELFSKTVTYPTVLAQVIGMITRAEKSTWEKLLKPTTVIAATVAIIFIMIIMVVAIQG